MKLKKIFEAEKNDSTDAVMQDLFHQNEKSANVLAARVMLLMVLFVFSMDAFTILMGGGEAFSAESIELIATDGILDVVVMTVAIISLRKSEKLWTRHLIIGAILFMSSFSVLTYSYYSILFMVFPPIFACRYFSRKYTIKISVISFILLNIVSFLHAFFGIGLMDLNCIIPLQEVTLSEGIDPYAPLTAPGVYDKALYALYYIVFLQGYRMIFYIIISIACTLIADKGHSMITEHAESVAQQTRVESELNMASHIQMDMLPTVFPQRSDFEIHAISYPARMVGGDFYDCFFVDETHLAILIADVSDKGVPAALFMVVAKTLIKNNTQMGISPAMVFTTVNRLLCENNKSGMFVTAWMAILNTVTGELIYVNAGHNPPMLRRSDGKYTYLRCKPEIILAEFDFVQYKEHSITMQKGDRIFLYTDGVTEAENSEGIMFGESRLEEYMNTVETLPVEKQLTAIRQHLLEYAHGAEQSDDITMLLLEYKGSSWHEKTFSAVQDSLIEADAFLREELSAAGAEETMQDFFSVCFEEIFINIVNYAYVNEPGDIIVMIRNENDVFSISFVDHGIAFDPTQRSDPDVTVDPLDRPIGGMGILLVKKRMDSVTYARIWDQNILTISKKLE